MAVINVTIRLIILTGIGFYLAKRRIAGEEFKKALTTYVLDFAVPCIIIKSLVENFSVEELPQTVTLILYGAGCCAFLFALGQAAYRLFGKTESAAIIRLSVVISNLTLFGFPVIEATLGLDMLYRYVIFTLPVRVFYYVAPAYLIGGSGRDGGTPKKLDFKSFFTPAIISIFIGILLPLLRIDLPDAIAQTVSSVAATCTPMGTILCGVILGRSELKTLLNMRYLRIPLLRNIIVPGIVFAAARLLPVDKQAAQLAVIYSALPMGTLLTVFAARYCREENTVRECSAAFFLSTVLAGITIPVWIYLVSLWK